MTAPHRRLADRHRPLYVALAFLAGTGAIAAGLLFLAGRNETEIFGLSALGILTLLALLVVSEWDTR
jgi:hypothetical protein